MYEGGNDARGIVKGAREEESGAETASIAAVLCDSLGNC